MKPETKEKYENFTLLWGKYIPVERRETFIIEVSELMADFGRDCFDDFIEHMRRQNEKMAGKSE